MGVSWCTVWNGRGIERLDWTKTGETRQDKEWDIMDGVCRDEQCAIDVSAKSEALCVGRTKMYGVQYTRELG